MAITAEGAKLTELHKILQVRLSSQAMAATKMLWSTMDPAQGTDAMDSWLKKQVALSGLFDKKSATLAADYVKKFRTAEGFPGGPIEGVSDFDPNWAENSLSYNGSNKVQMLMGAGVPAKEAAAQVVPYIMNAAQRMMLNGGRRVVDKSTLANPASKAWRRVADSNPCAFCAMMVARGPAYHSLETAGAGRHWHKRCGCSVEEVFGDWTPTPAEQRFVDAYDAAAAHLDSLGKPHAQTQILEHMRLNGKFNDSPAPKILKPDPEKVAHLKEQVKSGELTRAYLESSHKLGTPQEKLDLRAAINDLKPQPYPALGANFRVDHTGQIYKGYNWKIAGKTGTAWKKVDATGARLHPDLPKAANPAKVQSLKIQVVSGKTTRAKLEEAYKTGSPQAKLDLRAAINDLKPQPYPALGANFRIDSSDQIWKGYPWKIKGKTGVAWKKVDAKGERLHKDPPPKSKTPAEPNVVLPMKEYHASLQPKTPTTLVAPKVKAKAAASETDVVLKNEYQKTTAAQYGWGQTELKGWVKSGLPMHEYHASLLKSKTPTTPASPKVTAAPGAGGTAWANKHWPSASAYTSTERDAFSRYTGSGYVNTNSTLRDSQGKRGASAGLDQAFKRSTSVVPNDTVVYRGVDSAQALGLNLRSGDLSKTVGSEFVEHGYMSTAVDGGGFSGQIQMTIKVPKGHRAVYVSHSRGTPLSKFGSSEKELLLDRGTRFRITKAQRVQGSFGDSWAVEVEVIPPPVRL